MNLKEIESLLAQFDWVVIPPRGWVSPTTPIHCGPRHYDDLRHRETITAALDLVGLDLLIDHAGLLGSHWIHPPHGGPYFYSHAHDAIASRNSRTPAPAALPTSP